MKLFTCIVLIGIFGVNSFVSSDAVNIKCREKRINGYYGCDLRKLRISSRDEKIEVEETRKEIEAVRIQNGIVSYLPEKLLESFSNSLIFQVLDSQLISINRNDLKRMKDLEDLNLKGNKISELDMDTFEDLHKLKSLDISNNEIKIIPSKLFQSNVNIRSLSLSFNNIEKLHEGTFRTLLKLERLYISNNQIAELRDETFSENEALLTLDLSHNQLTYIGANIFNKIENTLERLNLSHNKCINRSMSDVSDDVRVQEMKKIKTELDEYCRPFPVKAVVEKYEEEIRMREQKCNETYDDFREEIANLTNYWNLEKTLTRYAKEELDSCQKNHTKCMTHLGDAQFQKNSLLDKLLYCDKMASNEINDKVNNLLEAKVHALEEENSKLRIEKMSYEKCLSFELICDSTDPMVCETRGVVTPLEKMRMRNVNGNNNTHILKVSDSFLSYLQANLFENFRNLKHFEATNANIRHIGEKTFLSAQNLEFLLLKNNQFKFLSANIFRGAEKLKTLKLESNGIEMLSSLAFKSLTQLENLHLRNNLIKEIPKNIFNDLTTLKILDLAENLLHHIDGNTLQLNINLEKIGISSNPITSIGEELLDKCSNLKAIYFGRTTCIPEAIKANSREEFKILIQEKKCSV